MTQRGKRLFKVCGGTAVGPNLEARVLLTTSSSTYPQEYLSTNEVETKVETKVESEVEYKAETSNGPKIARIALISTIF